MDKHPLRQVAKLEMYKGFVFGTFDETAPPLEEFLGRTGRLGLDFLAARDVESVPGIQKFVINCNWKFTVDNVFDWYHPQITHMSALSTGMIPGSNLTEDNNGAKTADGKDLGIKWRPTDLDNIAVLGEYGHAIAGESRNAAAVAMYPGNEWRDRPEVIETLGPIGRNVAGHPNIFPTTWVTNGAQLCLRVPRSPNKTEIWWFSFREKNKTPEENAALLMRQIHVFGPAGVLEQEDGENWVQSTMQTRGEVSREVPQLLKMGIGRGIPDHRDRQLVCRHLPLYRSARFHTSHRVEQLTFTTEIPNDHRRSYTDLVRDVLEPHSGVTTPREVPPRGKQDFLSGTCPFAPAAGQILSAWIVAAAVNRVARITRQGPRFYVHAPRALRPDLHTDEPPN